jgi:hypothetical protein
MDFFDFLGDGPLEAADAWDVERDVLTTRSFPSTVIYREQTNNRARKSTCTCSGAEKHRNFFDFSKSIVRPNLKEDRPIPDNVKVCWNARNIFEMKLPRELVTNRTGNRYTIDELPLIDDVCYTLRKGTYWFSRAAYKGGSVRKGLTDLGRQLIILLSGRNSHERLHNSAGSLLSEKTNPRGMQRLRNITSTIDGIIMQICLCFPGEEVLTWSNVDELIHCLLRNLVPDYIRPGNMVNTESSYEKIKRIRKAIKQSGFHVSRDLKEIPIPRELSFFRRLLKHIGNGKTPLDLYRVSVLCQTRASGVPPKTVFEKTFSKIKEVLQTPHDPETFRRSAPYVKTCMDNLHESYCAGKSEDQLSGIFARVLGAAKVSLSDSAEMFTTHQDGGKLEAAREVLSNNPQIPELDLDTGQLTGKLLTSENSTVGDRLFHWGLGHFHLDDPKATYDSNVMSVKISLVAEMGKYRGVTVSHLAHASVLHVFSHIGLEYLRGIPTSQSGISAANHAWNFFKRMTMLNPTGAFALGDEDTFLFSTDWRTATDYMEHQLTATIINNFAVILGFPNWYRRVIVCALTQPRQVEFLDEDKVLARFFTGRGSLMGDPGTKVILHLYHLICREAAKLAANRFAQETRS